jgi:hypothetical protein
MEDQTEQNGGSRQSEVVNFPAIDAESVKLIATAEVPEAASEDELAMGPLPVERGKQTTKPTSRQLTPTSSWEEVGTLVTNRRTGEVLRSPPLGEVICFYCKKLGHVKSKCPNKKRPGTVSEARSPKGDHPAGRKKRLDRGKEAPMAARAINESLKDQEDAAGAALLAAQDKEKEMEEEMDDLRSDKQGLADELEKLQKPFARAIEVLNLPHVAELLRTRPLEGISNVHEAIEFVRFAETMNNPSMIAPLMERLAVIPMNPPSARTGWRPITMKHLPSSYDEYMYCTLLQGATLATFLRLTSGAAVGGYLGKRWGRWASLGGAMAGLAVAHWLRSRSESVVLLKITHHFAFGELGADQQRQLSQDRRNISFRLARVAETSYGVRVRHFVTIQFTEDLAWIPTWSSQREPFLNFMAGKGWTRSEVRWKDLPPNSVLLSPSVGMWEPHLTLEAQEVYSAEIVRRKLRGTVPSLDDVVVDNTLIDWMTTHPRFMAADRTFDDVKAFLRLSFCANGQIANDFTSGDYRSLYPATAALTLVLWLKTREASSGKWTYTQEWGF